MSALGRLHFRAAMYGFAVTALFVSYQLIADSQSPLQRDSRFMLAFIVLCPPSLLSIAADPEVGTHSYYALWTLIAFMNAALYATIRSLLRRRLQRPD